MLIKNNILIISYIPYVYKDGGFCITINSKNQIERKEIELTDSEKSELQLNSKIRYENKTTIYKELLDEYFEELSNFIL